MEKEIVFMVDNARLSEFNKIELCLENCDGFTLSTKDILDIYIVCHEKSCDRETNYLKASGYIRLRNEARLLLSDFISEGESESDFTLESRLKDCKDLCWVVFYTDKEAFFVSAGFDAVCDFHSCEIEYSNCASVDFLPNGEVLIGIGEHSTQPRRVDNDYPTVIEGFGEIFPDFKGFNEDDGRLLLHIDSACPFYPSDNEITLCLEITCKNKWWRGEKLELSFDAIEIYNFDFSSTMLDDPLFGIDIMPLQDGRLFVNISNFYHGVSLYCKKISVNTL